MTGAIRGDEMSIEVDQVIVCTGFRPDLGMLSEVRLGVQRSFASRRRDDMCEGRDGVDSAGG